MENSAMSLTNDFYVDPMNYEMPDFYTFFNDYGRSHSSAPDGQWDDIDPYGLVGNWTESLTGLRSSALNEYNRQKELKEKQYSEAQLASARRYQEYLEGSKYQRVVNDIKAAGLNPWLALQSTLGSQNVQPGPGASRNSARYLENSQGNKNNVLLDVINTAIRVAGLIAMVA